MPMKAFAEVADLAQIKWCTLWEKPQGQMPTSLFRLHRSRHRYY